MRRKRSFVVTSLLAMFLSTKLFSDPMFPPLNESATEQFQPGKFIWADLLSADVESSVAFYTKTFGWEAEKSGNENDFYYLLKSKGKPIAGIVSRPSAEGETDKALWIGHISTTDVQAATAKSESLGAKIFLAPRQVGHRGTHAIIADPQGGFVGLLHSDSGDPEDKDRVSGDWVWSQLFSTNPKDAIEFYSAVFGYDTKELDKIEGGFMLSHGDTARVGVVPLPKSLPQRDRWVGFVRVENLDDVLNRAKTMGARLIYAPRKETLDGRLAIIADPNGALIGLITSDANSKGEQS